jgi:NAD(P)-dependent dehydrogenase (short-subunit alcohol dehydrogenase family)
MNISGKTILITGANRGIGQALVEEALKRGAGKVYAAARKPFVHPDKRVTPLILDVTDASQIREAAGKIGSLDILINNAGIALYDDLSDPSAVEKSLAVNLFGTYGVTLAFLPLLIQSKGAIVNNLSVLALAPLALIPGYCISKAAAFSMTQSQRALLAGQGVKVHAVMIGPTDTDMTRGLEMPKNSPEATAQGIFDGVENEEEEIFPDPISASMADSWNSSAVKAMERQNATFVAA